MLVSMLKKCSWGQHPYASYKSMYRSVDKLSSHAFLVLCWCHAASISFCFDIFCSYGGAGTEAPAGWLVYSDGEGLHVEDVIDLVVDVEVLLDH